MGSFADYECFGTTSRFRTLLQTANPWAFWQLRRVLVEFQPDVIHVRIFLTQLSPLILPLLRDVPSLYHVVWYRPICPLGTKMLPDGTACQVPAGAVCYRNHCLPLRDWLPLMLQMKLWRRWRDAFNLIVANSEAVRRRLIAEGIEPVEVVWNGVPIQPSRPPLSSPPTVAFAGRLVREKGVDVLLRAFAKAIIQMPEARLLLAGDGPERGHLERLVADLKLADNIAMLGHLPRQEVERHFAQAWVQAVPSRWEEPFANAALEAMMRGTAVVASDSGGMVEMVRDGQTGLLAPPGDVDALAKALLLLLQDREVAERMGKAGREVALAHFSQAACVDKFIYLYQALCKGGEKKW
jgi:glycosyltransferase involved in cell wall biosynthesis